MKNVKYAPQCSTTAKKMSFVLEVKEDLRLKFNAGEITREERIKLMDEVIGPELGELEGQARQEKLYKPTRAANLIDNGDGTFTMELPIRNPVMGNGEAMVCSFELDDVLRAEGKKGMEPEFEAVNTQISSARASAGRANAWPTANMNEGIE